MKKSLFFLLAILWAGCLFGQQPQNKGAGRAIQLEKKGTTRAVVVGISDYQNDKIPDLQYAHKDAEVFVEFLKSKAGGNLTEDQIMFLKNEDATTGQFAAALDWLIDESEEGDRAIIYFSGHGDVETKTAMHLGFLLTYDSPASTYIAGAFPLFYLQSVVKTLSTQNQAEVVLITDACRAGKLAGSEIDGAQVTTAALSQQFANEIKILSCQPEEYSLEGIQWGGGRGVFSYHLIEGLTGLADRNGDMKVNLLEIENYLEDKVPAETDPQSQIPMALGSKGRKLFRVDSELLEDLKAKKSGAAPMLAAIATKGFEDDILEKADSTTRFLYQKFKSALEEKQLMNLVEVKDSFFLQKVNSVRPENCAHAVCLYENLLAEESLQPLHRLMKRNLAAALQDEAQQAINDYLSADFKKMQARISNYKPYLKFPSYLEKAAELLGEKHYMYKSLTAKQLYFEGTLIRMENGFLRKEEKFEKAIRKLEQARVLEPNAPYILLELAMNLMQIKKYDEAMGHLRKANKLAPTWVLPYQNTGALYFFQGKYERAAKVFKMMIYKDSTVQSAYYGLGISKYVLEEYAPAIDAFRKATEIMPDPRSNSYLGYSYLHTGEFKKADSVFVRGLELFPDNPFAIYGAAWSFPMNKKWKEAEVYIKKVLETQPDDGDIIVRLAFTYRMTNRFEEAEVRFKEAIEKHPKRTDFIYEYAVSEIHRGNKEKGLQLFEEALQKGFSNRKEVESEFGIGKYVDEKELEKIIEKYLDKKEDLLKKDTSN